MIRSLYRAARERRWNRDRRERIAENVQSECGGCMATVDRVEEMAIQLAEIRTLPEVPGPQR